MSVTVSIEIVSIINLDVKVWTQKSELPERNFLGSLTQPKITRLRPVKLTDIEYDLINNEILMMKCVEYSTGVGRNVMNVDDIEDFANF